MQFMAVLMVLAVLSSAGAIVTGQWPATHPGNAGVAYEVTCVLGRDNARDAFVLDPAPFLSEARSWRSTIDVLLSWFSECVLR
jgi:hypothetical protein